LKKNGFTMKDVVSMYLDRPSIKDTEPHVVNGKILFYAVDMQYDQRRTLFDKIIDDLDLIVKCEHDENVLMQMEDVLNINKLRLELLSNLPFFNMENDNDIIIGTHDVAADDALLLLDGEQ